MKFFRKHTLLVFIVLDIILALLVFKVQVIEFYNSYIKTVTVLDTSKIQYPLEKSLYKRPVLLHAPLIRQMPELPRGCEVTSLAMLLQFAGVNVDKVTLAHKIQKVPFYKNGFYGDPNQGFVGSLTDLGKSGYGVYHHPLASLAKHYLGKRVVDLTGQPFDQVIKQVQEGRPVLVIVSIKFKPLPADKFSHWKTKDGTVLVSHYEHAVLVTGYTMNKVTFNNPLGNKPNMQVDKTSFILSWEQFGAQAISYY